MVIDSAYYEKEILYDYKEYDSCSMRDKCRFK